MEKDIFTDANCKHTIVRCQSEASKERVLRYVERLFGFARDQQVISPKNKAAAAGAPQAAVSVPAEGAARAALPPPAASAAEEAL